MKLLIAPLALFTLLTTLLLGGCGEDNDRALSNSEPLLDVDGSGATVDSAENIAPSARNGSNSYSYAVASLAPTEGFEATGMVRFIDQGGQVLVQANVEGLADGRHGIHIHEHGDCSAADASSAGGHFAPQGSPHGAPGDPADASHTGDLGNLTADAGGRAQLNRPVNFLSFTGSDSILGKALVIHAEPDDLSSQPAGDAGARVACGVIQRMEDPLASRYRIEDSLALR